tara:strand:+ start:22522 stop:23577 length:1056 start_codon:yes stop_codon:yes gene_type:complete
MKILSQGNIKSFAIKAAIGALLIPSLGYSTYLIGDNIIKPKLNNFLTQAYKVSHLKRIQKQCEENENENYLLNCKSLEKKGIVKNINDQKIIMTFNGEREDLKKQLSDPNLGFYHFENIVNYTMKNTDWFEKLSSFNQEIIQPNGDKYYWINVQIEEAEQFINENINLHLHDAINVILYHEIAHVIDDLYLYQFDNEDNEIVKKQKREAFSDLYSTVNTLKENKKINPIDFIKNFINKRKEGLEKVNHIKHFSVPALASLKHILENNKNFINEFNNTENDLLFLANITNHSINISTNYGKETNKQKNFLNSYLNNGLNDFHINVMNSVFKQYEQNKNYKNKKNTPKKLKII